MTSANVKTAEIIGPDGAPILVLRFSGEITSASKALILGAYQGVPASTRRILLDFSHVDYLNSSGIAVLIQMLIEAARAGQSIQSFGLSPHFRKVFKMVGIAKYTGLHDDERAASAAFEIDGD